LTPAELVRAPAGEPSAVVAARVARARAVATDRQGRANALLSGPLLRRYAGLDAAGLRLLAASAASGRVSARGADRLRRVARTLADLAGAERVTSEHLAEALAYRAEPFAGVTGGEGGG
jgi:magnesium chelatase family protein